MPAPASSRRGWRFVLAGVAVVAAIIVVLYSGLFRALGTAGAIVVQSLFPASMSWDSKSAYVKCAGAIADPALWPREPRAACAAIQMCANEAVLGEAQRQALTRAARTIENCGDP